jgi:TonB family protein
MNMTLFFGFLMRSTFLRRSVFFMMVAFLTTAAVSQDGRLMGRVSDAKGEPIKGATVYITSSSTTQAAVSNSQGYYTFLSVPQESYKIKTTKRGFDAYASEITVSPNTITRLDVKLGNGGKEVEVATVSKVEKPTTSTAVQKVIAIKKKDVQVASAEKKPQAVAVEELKTDAADKSAEELAKLTNENENADDMEQVATLEKNVEVVGGVEALFKKLKYPELAMKAGIEGKTVAQVYVDKDGEIVKVNFLKAVNPILDAEVMRVLTEETEFSPAKQKGDKAIAGAIVIPFNFKIAK